MTAKPILMINSHPPRLWGTATFCQEVHEFIEKANPNLDMLVISYTDVEGTGVFPLIDMIRKDSLAKKIEDLNPYAVHVEHEYRLYKHIDQRRRIGDGNER